jgi:diguanylate cyclase (GGDEF)-like protein
MQMLMAGAIAFWATTAANAVTAPASSNAPPVVQAGPAAVPQSPFDRQIDVAKSVMMADPEQALRLGRNAQQMAANIAGTEKARLARLTACWIQGEALTRLNRLGEAGPMIAEALAETRKYAAGSKLHGDLLKSQAAVAMLTGRVELALSSLIEAHKIFGELKDARSQAIVLQNIGSVYLKARDYQRVLSYYDQSSAVFSGDPALDIAAHNNRGEAYKELGDYEKAQSEYELALMKAEQLDSPLLEARIMTNIASTQFLRGDLTAAERTANSALQRGDHSSNGWQPFLWGVKAQVAFARGNVVDAKRLLERTFTGVNLSETPFLFRDFHETAKSVYRAVGNDGLAFAHLEAFKRIDDEARDVAVSTNSALMTAKFDAANQELRIAKLEAGQMQRDLALEKSKQNLKFVTLISILGGISAIAIVAAVSSAFVAAKRSQRKISAANAKLTYTARHDALTDLANRAYARELLATAIDSASREKGNCALFLVDLDRFKEVNDSLGHAAGDRLLCTVAQRLRTVVGGRGHVGRIGGDEFIIVIDTAFDRSTLAELANQIISEVSTTIQLDEGRATVGATIGIAVAGADGDSVDQLSRSADLALYRAKAAGRGRYQFFDSWMLSEADDRRLLEIDLRSALANDELSVAYQPIVDANDGRIVSYEALLRWSHPLRGEIPPSVFIPIAEEAGLIGQIGGWALRSACDEAAKWPEDIKIAVNLSALQVENESFTGTLLNALSASGLTPSRLELEVTESVFLRHGQMTTSMLERLRSLGVTLALDDFGTGYSALGYLQRADFSKIKIDRSFVQAAVTGCKEGTAIVQSIVALARGLGMETTAEGIESEEEGTIMRDLGCSQLQGFIYGRPSVLAPAAPGPSVIRKIA